MLKNKKIVIAIIVVILLIILGGIGLTVYINSNKVNPEDTLNKYIGYINEKNYEAMYELISSKSKKNISKEDYIARNKNIYEGIELSNISINITQITEKENKKVIEYTNELDTVAGKINFSTTATLEKQDKTYKIDWKSNLIFPQLDENYKVRVSSINAKRGDILDRNGKILSGEQTASQIGLVPGKMSQNKDTDIETIATLLDIKKETIENELSKSYVKDDTFVPLKTVLKSQTELKNTLLEISGIKIIDSTQRIYTLGEATSQLLGYIQDGVGKTGLEKSYEDRLKAINGEEIYIVDEQENKIKTLAKIDEKNGENIKLTIDSTIQEKLYEQFKEDKSASVAINPKTGEVLALVSTPTFNSNDFSLGMTTNKWNSLTSDESNPLYNRYLATYAPGSSFKPVIGAIGLTTNSFTEDENFGTSGTKWQNSSSWGDFYITTLSTYSGNANLKNALIYSDNIYFAKAALKIGKDNLIKGLKNIGFNEQITFVQDISKSIYSNSETFETETQIANTGYGQGQVLVNPIHMSMIYSAFVNDGSMIIPYIEYKDNAVASYYKENVFTKEAANTIKNDLIQVVENVNGTAHSAKIDGITLAGKTGTAEIKDSKDDKEGTEIGWFNAFIADENSSKQLLVISMVENVKGKGGSHYLLPKVKTVFE